MSILVISANSKHTPDGYIPTFSTLAGVPDSRASIVSVGSAKKPNVLEELSLRKIDLPIFGLAAIWCAFSIAKIIHQF